jgi:flagellar hook protein FlgE
MSFQQGLSGLNATSKSLEVIGNNIANASTYGAKGSRAEFQDLYAAALNGAGANAVGMGVGLAAVAQQFTQGNITATENSMDVAINGGGLFMLDDPSGVRSYSRNGQFKVDKDGFVVNNGGDRLLGLMANADGVIVPGPPVALQLPTEPIEPQATSSMALEVNLDKREDIIDAAVPVDFTDPESYNQATVMTAYDAAGQPVTMSYYFRKTAADTWDVYVTADGEPIADDGAGNPAPSTTLAFSADGKTFTSSADTLTVPANATTGTLAIGPAELSFDGTTQYGSNWAVSNLDQDGNTSGTLAGISIDGSGVVMARYTNGETKPAARIQLANFRNLQGLQPVGGNGWRETYASGGPTIDNPGSGAFGSLQAGALEESNVDMTGELVNMITAQRNYQANAQTIKTMDQVLQTLVNLR